MKHPFGLQSTLLVLQNGGNRFFGTDTGADTAADTRGAHLAVQRRSVLASTRVETPLYSTMTANMAIQYKPYGRHIPGGIIMQLLTDSHVSVSPTLLSLSFSQLVVQCKTEELSDL